MQPPNLRPLLSASALSLCAVGCADIPNPPPFPLGLEAASSIAALQAAPSGGKAVELPGQVFGEVNARGTGCPSGSFHVIPKTEVAAENDGFGIYFDKFVMAIGPSAPITENLKNCNILVGIRSPAYRQFALTKFIYRGYGNLEAGVTATHSTDYRFAGTQLSANARDQTRRSIPGPWEDSFEFVDDLLARNPNLLVWSDCTTSATLTINTKVTLTSTDPAKRGMIVMDVIDGFASNLEVDVTSRECLPPTPK